MVGLTLLTGYALTSVSIGTLTWSLLGTEKKVFTEVIKNRGICITTGDNEKIYPNIRKQERLGNTHIRFTINIPSGLGLDSFSNNKDLFEIALGASCVFYRKGKFVIADIFTGEIPDELDLTEEYLYKASDIIKKRGIRLGFPYGISARGLEVIDLTEIKHFLIGGLTGGGKTNLIKVIILTIINLFNTSIFKLYLVDLKRGVEMHKFRHLNEVAEIIDNTARLREFLVDELDDEFARRTELFKELDVSSIEEYNDECRYTEKLPYLIFIIDEFAEVSPKELGNSGINSAEKKVREECHSQLSHCLRQGRFVGFISITATQRPDKDILPGQLKANIPATAAFRTRNELNSSILLENNLASKLPPLPGRSIYQFDIDLETQVFNMGNKTKVELNQWMSKKFYVGDRQLAVASSVQI